MSKLQFVRREKKVWKITWLHAKRGESTGIQEECFKMVGPDQFAITSYTHKEGRLFGAVTFDQLHKLIQKDRGIYEIFPINAKRKVYFDCELYEDHPDMY